ALAAWSPEGRGLARKVDSASGSDVLSAIEERIARLADALESHNRKRHGVPDELESVVAGLIDKIGQVQPGLAELLVHLEHQQVSDLPRAGVASPPPDALPPPGMVSPDPEASLPRPPVSEFWSRAPEQMVASGIMPKPTLSSVLPRAPRLSVQPLQPGGGAIRGSHPASPAERIAASEAALAGAE